MSKVTPIKSRTYPGSPEHHAFQPDRVAQRLWVELSDASNAIAELLEEIPFSTSRGEDTRREYWQARALLKQAIVLLKRTESRESPRYNEADCEVGWQGQAALAEA